MREFGLRGSTEIPIIRPHPQGGLQYLGTRPLVLLQNPQSRKDQQEGEAKHREPAQEPIGLRTRTHEYLWQGMRPFVRREGGEWRQEGYDVEVTEEKLRYHKQNLATLIEESQNQLNLEFFRKLSFCLDLEAN